MKKPVCFVVSALLAACGSQAKQSTNNSAKATAQKAPTLADGIHLDPAALRAVGSLKITVPAADTGTGSDLTEEFCTATLVSPTLAVTAKHCLDAGGGTFYPDYYAMSFVVGDYDSPTESSKIIASFTAPGTDGDWGLGLDVGFVRLETPITDVTPLVLANGVFSTDDVGRKFAIIGQGGGTDERNTGTQTLRLTSGSYFNVMFPTVDAFGGWLCTAYGLPAAECQTGGDLYSFAQEEYAYYTQDGMGNVLEGRQAMFGGLAGEAVVQPGDSGGPTIGKQTNADGSTSLVVYAVTTGYAYDASWGTFSALVGAKEAAPTLTSAATWVDPCNGSNEKGSCSGDVANRCSIPGVEGPRRPVSTDCSLLNLTCVLSVSSYATCGVANTTPSDPASATSSPPAAMAQTASAVVSTIVAQSRHVPSITLPTTKK